MQVRLHFGLVARNPLRRSCVPSARNAGEIAFWIGRASLLEDVSNETLVLDTWRFPFGGRLVRNARFGDLAFHFWRMSRTKRSFCRLGASLLEDVLCETLVLETWRFTLGGSLVRNARFGDLALHFGGRLVRNARFGDLWRFTFGGCLVRNARFGDLALHFSLVLETWRFTFGGSLVRNARFGDLALHFWRKSRAKRWFWRLGASLFGGSLVRNARFGDLAHHLWSWTQTWPVCSANVGRERAFRSWTQKWPVCSTTVVREKNFSELDSDLASL